MLAPMMPMLPEKLLRLFLSILLGTAVLYSAPLSAGMRPPAAAYDQPASRAVAPNTIGRLGEAIAAAADQHPGESGFRLIHLGTDAFLERRALIRDAVQALDIQYYSMDDDITGKLLLEEIMRAADRGVRVRLLLDRLNLHFKDDTLYVVAHHPGVEVRIFNPMTTRQESWIGRATALFTQSKEYNRRMHDKAMIADNIAAIIGGRNLGDDYFDLSGNFNFSDIDTWVKGPLVGKISTNFDAFWNSDEAYPYRSIDERPEKEVKVAEITRMLGETSRKTEESDEMRKMKAEWKNGEAAEPITWAKARFLADSPDKIEADPKQVGQAVGSFGRLASAAHSEVIAIAPYFIPGGDGVREIAAMQQRGVKVRILTNSLASTDVPAVDAGYAHYRKAVLQTGAELHEFKPQPGKRSAPKLVGITNRSSLHAKIYVIDRKELVIASFNLDPRSSELNTEMGVVIESPALAEAAARRFDEYVGPNSYDVTLDAAGALQWSDQDHGRTILYHHDPKANLWRRFEVFVISHLPVEGML